MKLGEKRKEKEGRKGKRGKMREGGRDLPCDAVVVFNILLYETDSCLLSGFIDTLEFLSHQMANNCLWNGIESNCTELKEDNFKC